LKLELESLRFEREHTGSWVAELTVRDEEGRVILQFTEHCSGSRGGDTVNGCRQEVPADRALALIFDAARAKLRKIASTI